jgi:RimJ/RimL family protein N-acetyltransferase
VNIVTGSQRFERLLRTRARAMAEAELLSDAEVFERYADGTLPARWRMVGSRTSGVLMTEGEELFVERARAAEKLARGAVVCVATGGRLAWRRVLAVRRDRAVLRADAAPFAEEWTGGVVGRLRPRPLDRLAALAPAGWTDLGWAASMAAARAFAVLRHLGARTAEGQAFTARPLGPSDWPRVRAFWQEACGAPLHVSAQPNQHVVGLFLPDGALAGVNIQLVTGDVSYSAFTLVDRRVRGQGGGKKMVEIALGEARRLGVALVYVHIHARNFPSIAAYEACGFHFARWWTDESDPLLSAERQWRVYERKP